MTDVDWDLDDEDLEETEESPGESESGPDADDGPSGDATTGDASSDDAAAKSTDEAATTDGVSSGDTTAESTDEPATKDESADDATADDAASEPADSSAVADEPADDAGGWTRLRRIRVALGVGTFAAGLVLVVGAGWLPLSGLAGLVDGPGGRAAVVVLGLFAGLQGLWAAFRARSASPDLAEPPDPEPVGVERPPVTGGEFDAAVERLADPSTGDDEAREHVRRDLRRTAVTLLVERTGCTREEAATRITRGEWTDDVRAAAFLGGPDAATVPMGVRVREWLAPETPAGQRARRAAEEVVALAEDEP